MTDAEVREIDREADELTLRHGEIKDLAMSPMTMAFKVRETASLEALTPGDKVSFETVLEGGTLTATDIQVARQGRTRAPQLAPTKKRRVDGTRMDYRVLASHRQQISIFARGFGSAQTVRGNAFSLPSLQADPTSRSTRIEAMSEPTLA
jgi:hypothetical protein